MKTPGPLAGGSPRRTTYSLTELSARELKNNTRSLFASADDLRLPRLADCEADFKSHRRTSHISFRPQRYGRFLVRVEKPNARSTSKPNAPITASVWDPDPPTSQPSLKIQS